MSRPSAAYSFAGHPTAEAVRKLAQRILGQGWVPLIEHSAPEFAHQPFWPKFGRPLVEARMADDVMAGLRECRAAHPTHLVRLSGFDAKLRAIATVAVVYRGQVPPAPGVPVFTLVARREAS